ncbi:MAG: baseplate J/gp47 family protein [Deltaproteobacteria bacterium]
MSAWDDAITPKTESGIRSTLIGYAQAAGLQVSAWVNGDVGQQILETMVTGTYAFAAVITSIVRGWISLDTSTDPGDVDTADASNVTLAPSSGFLSNLGSNVFGTTRTAEGFASGLVTFTNAGPGSRDIAPETLTFTYTGGSPPSPAPTYRNSADASIYVNLDGTVTVGVGASVSLPIAAEEIGTASNAPPAVVTLTTVLSGCTATNAAAILGNEREDADTYRARCRLAPSRTSLGGPGNAIAYLASKQADGTALINGVGGTVDITRVYVTADSSIGSVDAWYASPTGPASADDVIAANLNISGTTYGVADCITFGPGATGGIAAVATSIHVAGSVSVRARAGVTSAALQTAVKAAIVSALGDWFKTIEIGGFDRVLGAGVVYTADLQSIARGAYPGLYDVDVTTPGATTTAITLGHVATLNSVAADWTVAVV